MKVLIVDDHAIVRRGLREILTTEYAQAVFGEAINGQEALDSLRAEPWDLVLLDLTMPGRSGIDVLKEVKHQWPKLPVLVCSMHPEDQVARPLLEAGASGYVSKDTPTLELINAVKTALSGGVYRSARLAEQPASS